MKKVWKKGLVSLAAASVLISAAYADRGVAFLIDGSGSMKSHKAEIQKVAKELFKTYKQDATVYLFNDTIKQIDKSDIDKIELKGGTRLSNALEYLHGQKEPPVAVVLITDGHPNDEKETLRAAKKLKDDKAVICSSYIGGGSKPKVLDQISDVSIIDSSLQASLDSCLNNAKVKEALKAIYLDDTKEDDLFMLKPLPQKSTNCPQKEKTAKRNDKKAMIFLIDASGENHSCDALRQSNLSMVKSMLSPKRLTKEKVADIYFGLFSRNCDISQHAGTKAYRGKTDHVRYRKTAKAAQIAFEKTVSKMHDFYEAIEQNGKKVHYGKDIYGAFQKAIALIEEEHLDSYQEVELVIVSDMAQSVNLKETRDVLLKKRISLPSNVKVTILGKALTCDTSHSAKQKIDFIENKKTFWQGALCTQTPVDYKTEY